MRQQPVSDKLVCDDKMETEDELIDRTLPVVDKQFLVLGQE